MPSNKDRIRLNAVHALNMYLYEKGKSVGVLNPMPGGRSPFAPVDQIAVFAKMPAVKEADGSESYRPYIVYNWSIPAIGTDWYIQSEQVVYLIYSRTIDEIREIMNFIIDTTKQRDRSAINVQRWLEKLPPARWGDRNTNPFMSMEIYDISVDMANGPSPIKEAGGLMEAMVSLNIKYGLTAESQAATDET